MALLCDSGDGNQAVVMFQQLGGDYDTSAWCANCLPDFVTALYTEIVVPLLTIDQELPADQGGSDGDDDGDDDDRQPGPVTHPPADTLAPGDQPQDPGREHTPDPADTSTGDAPDRELSPSEMDAPLS
ncbi:MAG TPA: hypothetical protein VEO01_24710 [Pseudonocardiaceae bacterium]|nr:hypothetical protein [Pseudonocardiaceae bacterium]